MLLKSVLNLFLLIRIERERLHHVGISPPGAGWQRPFHGRPAGVGWRRGLIVHSTSMWTARSTWATRSAVATRRRSARSLTLRWLGYRYGGAQYQDQTQAACWSSHCLSAFFFI